MIDHSKPVTHDGIDYPSRTALAKAKGVSRSAVYLAIKHGRMATLGVGTGHSGKSNWRAASAALMNPTASLGWWWPSQKDAAEAMGVSQKKVSYHLSRGSFDRLVRETLGAKSDA